ncbi:MAG: DUF507 family protein [Nitrospira sp.]|nr:DUF507 family protein [Nitrospira sp.]MCA9464176.1 DUF507 family protein [Nitrospira sp.]MCA9474713.1 DUF507 family protein [Nitrospira sp.]MCB9712055.1 DUF507 family protein [Nitrospiraceae bacterium]
MRLSKERVHHMAAVLAERLSSKGLFRLQGKFEALVQFLEGAITQELQAEDRLNAEVRDMLKQFEKEFAQGRADYQKMFSMVKQKLIKERGLVL